MSKVRLFRNIKLGVKDLLLHKLRSVLTALGMVFGVGSVVAMLSVGEGASKQALNQIRKLGSNNIIISSSKPSSEELTGEARTRMSMYGLLYDDQKRIDESIPYVKRTVPVRVLQKKVSLGERQLEMRIVGTTEGWFELVRRPILAGRAIAAVDIERSVPVCVLTEHGARRLLATRHTIGQTITIGSDDFEVIGIIRNEEAGAGVQIPDQRTDAYIPMNVSLQRFGEIILQRSSGSFSIERVELHKLLVEVKGTEYVERTAQAITAMMKRFHKKDDYQISVPLALLRQAEATKRTFNIVLGSIAGISLLVGGIGIMNIMLASVTERTREIGIRRAIGAKRRQIILQFLVETVVLSGAGGLMGVLLGITIPWIITRFSGMPTSTPLYSVVLSLAISMTIGIIFGLYPAMRAANLDPIEALRHE